MSHWKDGKDFDNDERSMWSHYDQLAATFCGIASTVFALVYVTGRDAPVPHSAAFLFLVTIYMNLWSLLVRYKTHYWYKRGLVYVSVVPFTLGTGLLMYLMLMS